MELGVTNIGCTYIEGTFYLVIVSFVLESFSAFVSRMVCVMFKLILSTHATSVVKQSVQVHGLLVLQQIHSFRQGQKYFTDITCI